MLHLRKQRNHSLWILSAALFLIGTLSHSVGQTVDPVAAQLAKANQSLRAGKIAAAEKTLAQVLKTNPNQAVALNMMGVVRARQKREREAEDYFQKALKADRKLAGAYSNLGILYRDRGQRDQALAMFLIAVDLTPQDPNVLYNLALLHGERGEFSSAIVRLKAIPVKQRPADYWEILGRLSIAAGAYGEAEEALQKVLSKNPESVATLRQLAGLALKRNNTDAAWKYMVRARLIAPNSPELLYEYAQVSLKNQLPTEAIVAMRKVVLLEPDRPEYLLALGKALMESPMEFGDALPFFERYVKLKPEDPEGHGSLGWAYYTNKDFVNARKEVEESLRLQPDQIIGYYQMGAIYYETGDYARAEEFLSKAIARQPDQPDAHLTLGMVYVRQGESEKARSAFETAERLNPDEPKAHYQLSQLYRRMGDREAATRQMTLYQQALQKFREHNERLLSTPSAVASPKQPIKKP
jgi:Flp pilus assembly protein TadD